jgi:hypothetical protein
MPARDEAGQRTREVVRRGLTNEGAAARPRLDDPKKLERAERFSNRSARNLELLRELPLRWELVARAEVTLLEEALDLLDDALIEAAPADRLDDGQDLYLPKSVWSGGQTRRGEIVRRRLAVVKCRARRRLARRCRR